MKENPIDKDKVAENPGLLPYASNVGGFAIKPVDKGRVKGNAMAAMEEQTNVQMAQLYKQMETLVKQAEVIKERVETSQKIYLAQMNFEPIIGHIYHLYEKGHQDWVVSMIAPHEWGRKGMPYETYLATVRLLSDHTWEVVKDNALDIIGG